MDFCPGKRYNDVKNSCEGGNCMRKYYLDNIRWITVVFVVIYHVVYMFNGIITDGVIGPFHERQYQDVIQYMLYPWFMILLFLVAGMCARYDLERRSVKEFVRARTRKLLVPSTLGLLAIGWVQGYFNMAISGAFAYMPDTLPAPAMYLIMVLSGTGVLWFIQMLWLFSMLLALARKAEKGKLYGLARKTGAAASALLVIPVYFSGLVLNAPIISVYRFGVYGFVFFLGYFVFAHDEVIDRISRFRFLFLFLSVLLGAVYIWLYYGDNYAVMPVVGSIPAVGFAWSAVLAILGGMKEWGDRRTKFSAFMAKREFGLYVFHYLPLSATAYLLHKYTEVPALPCYLLTACAAGAGGLVLYEAVSRIPLLRWCVLGIKKEKDNV